jgi:multiple RNA-binding domain-containing protein 1
MRSAKNVDLESKHKTTESKPSPPSSRIIVRNLPAYLDEQSLKKKFEQTGEITDCRIIFKDNVNRRFAYIGYKSESSAGEALKRFNNTYIDKSRITVDYAQTKTELPTPDKTESRKPVREKANGSRLKQKNSASNNEEQASLGKRESMANPNGQPTGDYDDKRVYIYNFPFNVQAEELEQVFSKFGRIEACKVINKKGQSLGYGFITFAGEDSVIRAIDELDNRVVFGRILHIKRCLKQNKDEATNGHLGIEDAKKQKIENEKSSFKKVKKAKFLERIHDGENWNSAFLNPNTVLERMAEKLGLSKKELLDNEIENPAVIQGVAEKEVLDEVFDFFIKNGVNVDCLKAGKATQRSRSIIFVKNLPYTATRQSLEELFSRYGSIERVLMPPNRAIGLVEFVNEEHAKNAFEMLADYVFKGTPIYLEWAPASVLDVSATKQIVQPSSHTADENNDFNAQQENVNAKNQKTVFVKNLNYQTTEQALEDMLMNAKIYGHKSIKIVRKDNQSLGFGFVEFDTREDAERMIKDLQGYLLDNHALKLSLARPVQASTQEQQKKTPFINQNTDRLIIRNVPFQANKQELTDLLKSMVAFKQIRLPQKLDGSLRGFAFVEFGSVEDCKRAFEQLQNLHFYGRRLAVEFSHE